MIVAALLVLTSCTTTRTTESTDYRHERTETLRQIDSLMRARLVEKQDSQSHKLVIRDSLVLRERTITNIIQTVDQSGNIISTNTETTTERDRDHSQQTEKEDVWISRMQTIDSLISINQQQSLRIDSLLQSQKKEVVKQAEPLPWYKRWWSAIKYIFIGTVIGIVLSFVLKLTKMFGRIKDNV